jgi:hypothetical protein
VATEVTVSSGDDLFDAVRSAVELRRSDAAIAAVARRHPSIQRYHAEPRRRYEIVPPAFSLRCP